MIISVCMLVVMGSTRYFCQILMKLQFYSHSKNTQISNFMIIGPEGAEMFHADRRTQTMKLIVSFGNFVNAPKNQLLICGSQK